jgi:hypothetical protein
LSHGAHRLLGVLGAALAASLAASPALAESEASGDYWDLVARFDSGHQLFAMAGVGNMGWGETNASVIGFVIDPDGSVHRFSRTDPDGKQHLSQDGRRLDLRSIVLDRSAPLWRFAVDKQEMKLELEIRAGGPVARPAEALAPRCPFEVLETSAPASGSLWRQDMPERVPLRGQIAVVHRAPRGLEADCLVRRVEVFALERDFGLYFTEVTTPDGKRPSWLVAASGGRVVYQGAADAAELRWRDSAGGYPQPASFRLSAPRLSGRVEMAAPAMTYDPTERLSGPLRWAVSLRTRPLLTAGAARFELALGDGRHLAGTGIARVSYTNPMSAQARDPQLAGGK